jgi:hypothetical protein
VCTKYYSDGKDGHKLPCIWSPKTKDDKHGKCNMDRNCNGERPDQLQPQARFAIRNSAPIW